MPTHVYRPLRNPPTWFDRLMVHPLDTTVAAVCLVFAALLLASTLFEGFVPSRSLEEMPQYIRAALSLAFLGGGVLVLVGLNWMGEVVSKGWALERFGWLLSAGGFVGYSISVSRGITLRLFSRGAYRLHWRWGRCCGSGRSF